MIKLTGVRKSFRTEGGAPPNHALKGISLTVPKGCLYGLIGPGAAGKTVLLKTITGLLRADAGSIEVDGAEVTTMTELDLQKMRVKIGFLFQNYALFDTLTVRENIAFPLQRLYKLPPDQVEARVMERLACVALSGFEDRLTTGLSGGQKKRVGVARATVIQAPIVLYDEPAAGLDPVTSQKIFELLRAEQRASGATCIMVSSDLDRMLTVTDRVGMMYKGDLIFDGTTQEAQESENPYVKQFVHGLTEGPL